MNAYQIGQSDGYLDRRADDLEGCAPGARPWRAYDLIASVRMSASDAHQYLLGYMSGYGPVEHWPWPVEASGDRPAVSS